MDITETKLSNLATQLVRLNLNKVRKERNLECKLYMVTKRVMTSVGSIVKGSH